MICDVQRQREGWFDRRLQMASIFRSRRAESYLVIEMYYWFLVFIATCWKFLKKGTALDFVAVVSNEMDLNSDFWASPKISFWIKSQYRNIVWRSPCKSTQLCESLISHLQSCSNGLLLCPIYCRRRQT